MANSEETLAITVDGTHPDRLVIRSLPLAPAAPDEVTVKVTAISLNRGEVRRGLSTMEPGTRPGWDFVGVVEAAAATGAGPKPGERVVGFLQTGAWAARLRAPVTSVAVLPAGVSDAEAATLPVAGLTALHAVRQGGALLGRKVLVDGATGGVGHAAIQLAALAGAEVFAHVRREEQRPIVEEWCNGGVIVGPTLEAARSAGPFHLALDSIGGAALGTAMQLVHRAGTCVAIGVTEAPTASFDVGNFIFIGGAKLYGLFLGYELATAESASDGLAFLARLVERKALKPRIELEAPWTEIAAVGRQLIERGFAGKAVLHLPS